MSTFHGLELGKRGLMIGQISIGTTGHNIANANTKGYARQQVNATSSQALDVYTNNGTNQLGTGVSLDSISRVRDRFLDQQYRDQSGTLEQWQAKQATLDGLETIINEPSDTGLNAVMNQLQGAWQDLANDPDSVSAQIVVKERGQTFVDVAQSMDKAMTDLKTVLDAQSSATMDEANGYLAQIAELNTSIKRSGNQANDLLDQRDLMVEKLSELVTIDVKEQSDGTTSISLIQSDGTKTSLLDESNQVTPITSASGIAGGRLGGISQSIVMVDGYQEKLSTMVEDFAKANGMSTPPDTAGGNLFIGESSFTIASLKVNSTLNEGNPPTLNTVGNPHNAQTAYQAIVSELGTVSQAATNYVANYDAALRATEGRRQSVTGVSLDEEMANLIKFQHSYSSAARMVSTTDEMLDTIINRMAAH